MPGLHSLLSPSSAHRWLVCAPSARFEEQIPNIDNAFAAEGTLAHDLAALVLSLRSGIFKGTQVLFNTYLKKIENKVNEFYADQGKPSEFYDMLDHAEDWAAIVSDYGGTIHIEKKYDISKYVPMASGTSDGTNETPDILYVSDYKYGAGVRVAAKENKQAMLYAVGALLHVMKRGLNPKTVVISIFQPRMGGLSTWEISVKDLLDWAEHEVKPMALLAQGGQGEFVAGEHCKFCRAKTVCKAYFDMFDELLNIHDKREMNRREMAKVLTYGGLVSGWVDKVKAEAHAKLSAGKSIPGFKLVAGRSTRKFKNEDAVVEELLAANFESFEIYNPALRSLTDLEKHLGKKRFNAILGEQITLNEGNPILVPKDDDRPAVCKSGADEYDDDQNSLL